MPIKKGANCEGGGASAGRAKIGQLSKRRAAHPRSHQIEIASRLIVRLPAYPRPRPHTSASAHLLFSG